MAVTRSTPAQRAATGQRTGSPVIRRVQDRPLERVLLLGASLLVLLGLAYVWFAKAEAMRAGESAFDLRQLDRQEQLLPVLQNVLPTGEREYAARQILNFVRDRQGKLPNVGALARLSVTAKEIRSNARLAGLRQRVPQNAEADASLPLFTGAQFSRFKPLVRVRDAAAFRWQLLLWAGVVLLVTYAVHGFWISRGFDGDQRLLPVVHLLTGIGLVQMVSLRDPLRDTLAFADFGQAIALATVVLAGCSLIAYERVLGRLSFVPLIGAFALSVALILFGTGPGESDAKVNLLGVQPAEGIKVLLLLFLAGYFARRWELLRTLKQPGASRWVASRWMEVPRLEYALPVMVGVAVALAFFFLQKDLGPAVVLVFLFLAMYAVARDRYLLAAGGLTAMAVGVSSAYWLGFPQMVRNRVAMWLSPWDNAVRGGEQVVHGLWAMATGSVFGMGPGLGDPELIPAGHTDLILAVLGEEWGFLGVLAVFGLYAVLVAVGLRIALRARTDYAFFLALGITLLFGIQILFITGGVLDLVPLSGIVTPFLSYGGTAMLANFFLVAMLLSLSQQPGDGKHTEPFRPVVTTLGRVLALGAIIVVGKAAWVQVLRADDTVGAGALTLQADGQRRFQYNPRLLAIARSIPRGTVYDRNGLPVATSNWEEIAKFRETFARFGMALPVDQPLGERRFYPLGAAGVHLLGDLRTRANWGARNSSLLERDSAVRLQGYDDRARVVEVPDPKTGQPTYTVRYDYRELLPLLRHRYEPNHEAVKHVRERERNVRMALDARLQWRVTGLLRDQLQKLKLRSGAVVVMDAESGDLLAAASYPLPAMPARLGKPETDETLLDRARYGLYPPGSTFKVVTAMAALRQNIENAKQVHVCQRLPDGRVGNYVKGWGRPIRDDVADKAPHGPIAMEQGVVVSCNAYFAQLATYNVGAPALWETANQLGIATARPNTADELKKALPQAGYGQAEVVASPFQMARVAATVAADGKMPYGRWVTDESNPRTQAPASVVSPEAARLLQGFMRGVVTRGTGRAAAGEPVGIAGKTGTAEVENEPSHAWFIGYAPAAGGRKIAFAVLIENGRYGGSAAAPLAAQVVGAARELGMLEAAP